MTVVVWLMLGAALTAALGFYGTRDGGPVVEGIGGTCPDCGAGPGVSCHPACSTYWD